jgi:hypothetical protein
MRLRYENFGTPCASQLENPSKIVPHRYKDHTKAFEQTCGPFVFVKIVGWKGRILTIDLRLLCSDTESRTDVKGEMLTYDTTKDDIMNGGNNEQAR